MAEISLEERVSNLERQMATMLAEQKNGSGDKDWRRTIGMFTDNPEMQELFAEAQRIREEDRKKVGQTGTGPAGS